MLSLLQGWTTQPYPLWRIGTTSFKPKPCGAEPFGGAALLLTLRALAQERRPAPLGQAALSGPQASGTPSTGRNRFKASHSG